MLFMLVGFEQAKKDATKLADTIFINGNVYTVEAKQPWAEAVAIKNGKIIYVGNTKGAKKYKNKNTKIIDLKGKMLLPGFVDSHLHASETVNSLYSVDLVNARTVDEYVQAVEQYRKEHSDVKVIHGAGWSNTLFSSSGPTKDLLDAVVKDIPVALISEDYHSVWANSKALEIAEITKDSPNPNGGVIERNENGEPSGTLRDTATNLVLDKLPKYNTEQYKEGLKTFQQLAASNGYTQVNDVVVPQQDTVIEALTMLEKEQALSIRHNLALTIQPNEGLERIPYVKEQRTKLQGPLVKMNSIKLFMDGVIEGGTAYLHEPYNNKPNYYGVPVWEQTAFKQMVQTLDKEKFQVHIHSIGDAATTETLNTLAIAQEQNGKRDSRHKITHLQLVKENDIARFKDLGVIGVPQPTWFLKDGEYFAQAVELLGEERANEQYPMRSFINKGVVMTSSSDYPITQGPYFSPLAGIQMGITRTSLQDTNSQNALNPKEKVSLAEMIKSYTINGAYANFLEKETGSIKVGKKADLVVLDKNLFKIPKHDIHKTKILLTLLEGKETFRHTEFR
ncbi:amidohydrolase [Bacillus albus]|uniref:amidohydrolase n=1 Tax=Bacillus cereus group TaxID=86661 RepID=UPI001AB03145|nr:MULTISPECIES: amidohydrolase [Bacillus cereus group]MBU5217541.1 amidohydrolase [Bacillus albus]MDA2025636.1 amidohydrolase [Bacillus cereus group sp. Bcc03]MDA2216396.1 amidohydrolase [Bacillus cereus group sp. Bc228]MDA2227995.1 amidohydrolase [Bacillus cereus group sp. Bc227]MDA2260393.1 amidohydrolase [Bacillus cereus group sp. Bc200]